MNITRFIPHRQPVFARLCFRPLLLTLAAGVLALIPTAGAARLVSGTDAGVRATTLATSAAGSEVVVFWESTQFANHEHLRFNRSGDGGETWRVKPFDFPFNVVNGWTSDYLPKAVFDQGGGLHLLWSQRNDTEGPGYVRSTDVGDTWTKKVTLGGGTLPRKLGLGLVVGESGKEIWAFYQDYRWHGYACQSADDGQSWTVVKDLDGGLGTDPTQSFCSSAAGQGTRRYVLRQSAGVLNVLCFDGNAVTLMTPLAAAGPLSLAATHTMGLDAKGRVFIVFGTAGRVYLMRSDDHGATFGMKREVAPAQPKGQLLPVLALLPDDQVVVAWQQQTGEKSQIHVARSTDAGETFAPSVTVSPSDGTQSAPDMVAAGKTVYFSYTENGQAYVERQPELPAAATGNTPKREAKNLFLNPGFEDFTTAAPLAAADTSWGNPQQKIEATSSGTVPQGWTVSSWNQEFMRERFGQGRPGRDGRGSCLEMQPTQDGSTAGVVNFVSRPMAILPDRDYFFRGYYASTCERLVLRGEWLNAQEKVLSSFAIRLPDTQDEWIHFFKALSSPMRATQVRWTIEKKWQQGRVRFDDFSLREGTVADYASEFPLPVISAQPWFPIYGWLSPDNWAQFGAHEPFNRDEYHLDYALANFTVGSQPKFGLRYHTGPPSTATSVTEMEKNPALWSYHGGDEPMDPKFPELAKIAQSLRERGANKPYWVNLLPTYGFPSYEAYEKHVRNYMDTVPTKLVTYDHYAIQQNGPTTFTCRRDFFANLEIFRRLALERGIDWGIIVQLGAWGGQPSPNENGLRWQAFNSLAYGARSLGWFCYLTEFEYGGMNWRDNVIDRDGFRTNNYTKIRRLNAKILQLGKTLIGLRSTGVYHTAPLPELTQGLAGAKLISGITGGAFVLGEFTNTKNERYFMIVNRDLNAPATAILEWQSTPRKLEEISPQTGALIPAEGFVPTAKTWVVALVPGEGRLYRVTVEGR